MNHKPHCTRIIEWSHEDQCYLGSLPELLLGHCTHGDTWEEVNSHLNECEEMALVSKDNQTRHDIKQPSFPKDSAEN